MRCKNHPKDDAAGICTVCGSPFCSDCLIQVKRKNICTDCASSKLESNKTEKDESEPKQLVFQQQQQQQQPQSSPEVKTGAPSKTNYDLIKWIISILLFLLAFGAFGTGGLAILSGLILLLLAIYWMPPVMLWVQKFVYAQTGIVLPRWLRVSASLFVFFIAILISPHKGA